MSRTKEQWLRNTGGSRICESKEEYSERQRKIAEIKKLLLDGKATTEDIETLSGLLGNPDEEE